MPKEAEKLKTPKACFVIAPIGEEGTETRRRSDQVLTHIIKPAAKECGYETVRADEISEPGIITSQILQHLIDDDLVIADLSDKNPNVFYELAVRHTVKKPIVQIIQSEETIPFDVAPSRTIHFDHRDLDSVANCGAELVKQIRAVEKDPSKVDSPISVAIDLKYLNQSENPLEKSNAEIISMLQELRTMVSNGATSAIRRIRTDPRIIVELLRSSDYLTSTLELEELEEPSRERFNDAKETVYRCLGILEMFAMESDLPRDSIMEIRNQVRRLREPRG